ncbi:MAG: hypothetical protein EOO24_24625 [Comamonadaceae bacterium]|nr:MAG: hypothetical protein EOO24_24625 [Comamonadaceae bacterium]
MTRRAIDASPLDGWTVVSLRPRGQHQALRAAAARACARMLALSPLAIDVRTDAGSGLALRDALAADLVLFTSPNAVSAAAVLGRVRNQRGRSVLAVGEGTRHALQRLGVDALSPTRMDSEGLLAMPALRDIGGRRIGLVTAPGGRNRLAPALQARGAELRRADVYARMPVAITDARWQALARALANPAHVLLALSSAEALDARVDSLRQLQRTQAQRLQQAEATNRVLRDELLGIGQRAALLEDSVSKLADPDRHGAQALRLDEIELLLGIGQQRLRLDDDIDGARRALALAAPLLAGLDDPAYLNLRQALAQEQAALQALGADPRIRAKALLERIAAGIDSAMPATAAPSLREPWYQRLLGRVVHRQPTAAAGLAQRPDRDAALAALQIEFSLARAAVERRDSAGLHHALARIDGWLQRLLAGSPGLPQKRRLLAELKVLPLRMESPLAGTTLQQLRALRGT